MFQTVNLRSGTVTPRTDALRSCPVFLRNKEVKGTALPGPNSEAVSYLAMMLVDVGWFAKGVLLFGLAGRKCWLIESSFQTVLVV